MLVNDSSVFETYINGVKYYHQIFLRIVQNRNKNHDAYFVKD